MSLRFKLIIAFITFILVFPTRVNADELYSIYYFKDDRLAYDNLLKDNYIFCGNFNTEEKAFILLESLFDNVNVNINYIPEGTKVLNVYFDKGNLIVNLSKEIKSYGGGSTYEVGLIKQILYTLFELNEVFNITIFIDGQLDYFPEGSLVYEYDRVQLDGEFLCK